MLIVRDSALGLIWLDFAWIWLGVGLDLGRFGSDFAFSLAFIQIFYYSTIS